MELTVHVEGRTPGDLGKDQIVTLVNGVEDPQPIVGSHHEAVYLAAIIALARARATGVSTVAVSSPSEHLIEQMTGKWRVGPELQSVHAALTQLASTFGLVTWSVQPRSD